MTLLCALWWSLWIFCPVQVGSSPSHVTIEASLVNICLGDRFPETKRWQNMAKPKSAIALQILTIKIHQTSPKDPKPNKFYKGNLMKIVAVMTQSWLVRRPPNRCRCARCARCTRCAWTSMGPAPLCLNAAATPWITTSATIAKSIQKRYRNDARWRNVVRCWRCCQGFCLTQFDFALPCCRLHSTQLSLLSLLSHPVCSPCTHRTLPSMSRIVTWIPHVMAQEIPGDSESRARAATSWRGLPPITWIESSEMESAWSWNASAHVTSQGFAIRVATFNRFNAQNRPKSETTCTNAIVAICIHPMTSHGPQPPYSKSDQKPPHLASTKQCPMLSCSCPMSESHLSTISPVCILSLAPRWKSL